MNNENLVDEKKNIYISGEYFSKNPTYDVIDSPWKAKKVLEIINKHNLKVNTVCEIGCGAGEILKIMQEEMPQDIKFFGYDISPDAINLADEKSNENLSFYAEDLIEKDTEKFDLITCLDVIEHVDDYLGFLRSLKTKATYKIFNIPLDLSVRTVAKSSPIMRGREKAGHLHYFIKDTALATLKYTGYEILDWQYGHDFDSSKDKTSFQKMTESLCKIMYPICPDFTVRLFGTYSLFVLAK